MNERLVWKEEGRKTVFTCPVFSIEERYCRSPSDKPGTYTILRAADWAIIIPALDTERGREFVMVRQWRHGARELSVEFPGGVLEKGEDPEAGAVRELREETGYSAKKIVKLGEFNPNPAIMANKVYFFLALDLSPPAAQELDEDEYVEVVTVPCEEVLSGFGKPPYIHALMATAMALYMRHKF
ncbi:MAG: NUDIX hydrolase [Treponema sp.]|jgi:8-oxo-dGTP pyrophosphatase MutT (NUDIX family)|nr:NUDIX hydrolase [Treponema sp.]